jgi:putative FmdB family regulatory protein
MPGGESSLPLYEYQCAKCGALQEIRHGFDETPQGACETCGGELKRTFNVAGIVFKGSGFYVTDSRKSTASGDGAKSSPSENAPGDGAAKPSGESPAKSAGDAPKSSESAKSGPADAAA